MHQFESDIFRQCPYGQIGKVASLKRKKYLGSNPSRGTKMCECATERLGGGLQIRFMQVRFLSPTPSLLFVYNSYQKKSLTFSVVVIYSCLFFKNLSLILLRSSIG